jgi:hypothetical protein
MVTVAKGGGCYGRSLFVSNVFFGYLGRKPGSEFDVRPLSHLHIFKPSNSHHPLSTLMFTLYTSHNDMARTKFVVECQFHLDCSVVLAQRQRNVQLN